jgi:hypothetical protein
MGPPAILWSVIEAFLRTLELPADPKERLTQIVRSFRKIPYENLTKIIRHDRGPGLETAEEVLSGYLDNGSGGTCFSIVNALHETLSAAGIDSHVVLADRHYGPDTHCALLTHIEGKEWLLDPGYLIFEPIELPRGKTRAPGGEMQWSLRGDRIEASTVFPNGFRKIRYTLKPQRVSKDGFVDAWKRSFDFEMMNYPVVTRILDDGRHVYLRDGNLMVDGKRQSALGTEEIPGVVESLGIRSDLARRALRVLGRA